MRPYSPLYPVSRAAIGTFFLSLLLIAQAATGQLRTLPRPTGNWFAFPEQRAVNTINLRRLPAGWSVPASRPVLLSTSVPFPAGADGGRYLTNGGVTHVEGQLMVNLNLPSSKRWFMLPDHVIAEHALAFRSNYAVGSAEYNALTTYGQNYTRQVTPGMSALWEALGRYSYGQSFAGGIGIASSDIEVFSATADNVQDEFKRAWTIGLLKERNSRSHPTNHLTYGIGTLAGPANYVKNREQQDEPFRIPGHDWIGSGGRFDPNASEMTILMRGAGHLTYVGRDQYWRTTWGDNTVYQKNSDGSIKADGNGKALYVRSAFPTATVSNYGTTARVYTEEAKNWVEAWYSEYYKAQADWSYLCNRTSAQAAYDGSDTPSASRPYPKGPSDLNPAMANVRLCTWIRPTDTEAGSQYNSQTGQMEDIGEPESNRRIINARSHRFLALIRGLFYHANVVWDDKGYAGFSPTRSFTTVEGGTTVTKPPLKMGGIETVLAGLYQARSFPRLFSLMDAGGIDFVMPKKGVVKSNDIPGEYEWEKPIVHLWKETGGRRVWAMWVWPSQDVANADHERDMAVWVDLPNGNKTGSYRLRFKDRNVCLDGWQLPAGFESARPQDFRFQFQSLPVGSPSGYRTITWTGDYNVVWSGANPSPPAWVTPASSNTTTTTGGGSTTTVACNSYGGGQTLVVSGGQTIRAYRTDANVLFAASASDGTNFKNRAWLVANAGLTSGQAACFTDTNPFSSSTDPFQAHNLQTKRWAGIQLFHHGFTSTGAISPSDKTLIELSAARGMNAYMPAFQWRIIEPLPGNFNWAPVDSILATAKRLNLKILGRIVASRSEENNGHIGFITDDQRQKDNLGRNQRYSNQAVTSYDSPSAVARQEEFVRALIGHIRASPWADMVMGFSVVDNRFFEAEYVGTNQMAGSNQPEEAVLADYSEPSRQKFIARMTAKYTTVGAANSAWGTNFSSWAAVQLPPVQSFGNGFYNWQPQYQRDFFVHRARSMAEWINYFAGVVKSISPNLQTFSENGSLHDPSSGQARGSMLLPLLGNTDGRKQNDTPTYPHYLSAAVSRVGGKWTADEVDGMYADPSYDQALRDHFVQGFDAGNSVMVFANPEIPGSGENPTIQQRTISRATYLFDSVAPLLSQPVNTSTTATLSTSAAQLLQNAGFWGGADGNTLKDQYETLRQGGSVRVGISITNNLN